MCDPVLIAAILQELGYFDEGMGKEKKREISDKERNKDRLQDSGGRAPKTKITDLFIPAKIALF